MKTIKRKTTDDYKVAIIGITTTEQAAVDIELSAEEALILADQIRENALSIMDEVYNMPVVPQIIKALIDCGKVSRLEYSNISASDEEEGMVLYNIRVIFTDGKSRNYKYECKFFENKEMHKMQMEYIKNTPIIFRDNNLPPHVKTYDGKTGYNLVNNIVTTSDLSEASMKLSNVVRNGKPQLPVVDLND